jgi:hypothetical protein
MTSPVDLPWTAMKNTDSLPKTTGDEKRINKNKKAAG